MVGLAASAVCAAVLLSLAANRPRTAAGSPETVPSVGATDGQPVTEQGAIVCLPRSGKNPTVECTIGLQTKDNAYYALVDGGMAPLDPTLYTEPQSATVTGRLVQDPGMQDLYLIDGTIKVDQIR